MQNSALWTVAVMMMTLFVTSNGVASPDLSLEDNFKTWSIQTLDYLEEDNDEILVAVKLDQEDFLLKVRPRSMRSVEFKVQLQIEGGEYVDYDPPAPQTYRGSIVGVPGSNVGITMMKGQIAAIIDPGEGAFWYIEPLSKYDNEAGNSEYVVYSSSDVQPTDGICGNDMLEMPEEAEFDFDLAETARLNVPGSGKYLFQQNDELCDIGFDTDWEFYRWEMDRDPDAVVADIEYILNGVEVVYLRDTEICYNITHIIIRTTADDPYEGNNAGQILNQFRNHWWNQQGDIVRDVAHLMVGRGLGGFVLGVSYLSTVCQSYTQYGLSQTKFTNNYDRRVTLTAHEMGHSWSAGHCDGDDDCYIMCSMLGGCEGIGLPNFGSRSITSILNHKSTRTCLDDGCSEIMDITEPDPGIAGQESTIGVRGAAAGSSVKFYFNVPAGSWEVPECPGLYLDMDEPKKEVTRTADSDGNATITMTVPSGMVGRTLRMQAADITTCEKSDVEVFTFE
jgi:hypothetical protein